MVVIRLSRVGQKHKPKFRITVADSRHSVLGRFIEIIGRYDGLSPNKKDKTLRLNMEKYNDWLSLGAKPSLRVKNLVRRFQQEESKIKKS